MSDLAINYQTKLEINTTPNGTEPTWERMCEGFSNLSESLNEVIYQATYLCSDGWGSSEVTGGQYTITLTGDRRYGDPAQDWIFSNDVEYAFGAARKTTLRITRGDETVITWDVTLVNITEGGGDSNQPNAITVTIHGNGMPTFGTD